MSARRPSAERAARPLHWYPRPWRDRYGAEFTELLISDIEERPRSLRRAVDVARGGLALAASVIAAVILIRGAGLPPRVLVFEVRLATAACAVMPVVFGAAAC